MEEKYNMIICKIIISMIITCILYFIFNYCCCHEAEIIANLSGNIFAGLVTGLILAELTKERNKAIDNYAEEISICKSAVDNANEIYNAIQNLNYKKYKDVFEIHKLYGKILEFLLLCQQIEGNHISKIKDEINIRSLVNELENQMKNMNILEIGEQNSMSQKEYENKYYNFIKRYNRILIDCKMAINNDIILLNDRKRKFKRNKI